MRQYLEKSHKGWDYAKSASFLPQDARIVATPNVIDIYMNDRVQYQPSMVRPGDTVIVSKKKPECNHLWACLIGTIICIFLFVITYNMTRSSKVQQTKVLENGHCAGITGPKSTFLWTINAPHLTSTSYLFGTIHKPNLWNNVSSQAKNAFKNSDALALEIDLRDPGYIKKMNTCFKFPNGTAIELFPSKTDVRQRIKRMAEFFQMNVGEFKNPDGFNNLTNLTNEDPILDEVLSSMAKAEGKPVISVETADEDCERLKIYVVIENALVLFNEKLENILGDYEKNQYPYSRLSKNWRSKRSTNDHMSQEKDEVDHLLIKTYACNKKNFTTIEDKIRKMNAQIIEIQSWRARNWYELIMINQMVEIYKVKIKLYEWLNEVMLTKRNVIMGKRIDEMLRKNPNTKYFIAFGVAHLIEKDSVQDHLINYGYTIKEVPFIGKQGAYIL
uniref:Metalloprotease TIKI homolog n=1 Tax=Acrobeloides nanus TaxID=290746 RepID=A0A914CCL3_9BILA